MNFCEKRLPLFDRKSKKNRIVKKTNKAKINFILSVVPFKIESKCFGSGYFIFKFAENSVCWFKIKNIKDWKFGIWLNEDNTFDIFGEAIVQIDKFKPSRSVISRNNIREFTKDVHDMLNNKEEWKEYNETTKNLIIAENKANAFNQIIKKDINLVIKKENSKNNETLLELKDFGENFSPRYEIQEYTYDQKYDFNSIEAKERTKNLYLALSECIAYHQNDFDNETLFTDFDIHDYIFNSSKVYNKMNYNEDAIKYNWNIKDFDEYVKIKLP